MTLLGVAIAVLLFGDLVIINEIAYIRSMIEELSGYERKN